MAKKNKCENRLLNLLSAQEWHLDRLYSRYSFIFSHILKNNSTGKLSPDKTRQFERAMMDFNGEVEKLLQQQISNSFTISDACNDDLALKYIKGLDPKEKQINSWLKTNDNALDSFIKRKAAGLNLSDRVWSLTQQTKDSLENVLETGILTGRSAAETARDLKKYLKEPDRNFRRVRNTDGKLILSNPAKNYHPGQGVYRSSYKNALRLSRNEINIAYRTNDFERRQNMPFVTGQNVRLSAAHPQYDICFTQWNYKITTSKGPKNIKDIELGDLVLTHKGRFRKVIQLFKNSCFEVDKTTIKYKVPYDNRSKTKVISATSNHPFLINGEWKAIGKAKAGDTIKILAVRCKTCDKKIPYYRDYCSKSCSSTNTAVNQWKSEEHRENVTSKRNTLIEENGGVIPFFQDCINSGKNVKNLLKPETKKKSLATRLPKIQEAVKNGEFHLTSKENLSKAAKALGNSHNRSFIEKKMEWLLNELKIKNESQAIVYRDAFKENGQRRYYKPDFVLTDYKVIVECDGEYWHNGREKEDAERQSELESMGYVVLRFPGSQIRKELKSVSDEIQRVVYNHEGKYEFLEYPISEVRNFTQKQKTPITKWNFEVEEDNSYIVNGVVVHNCDELVGTYPKSFLFTGWHVNCLCVSESLLLPRDKFKEYLGGGDIDQRHMITSVPKSAIDYLNANAKKINSYKSKPYFIANNFKYSRGKYVPVSSPLPKPRVISAPTPTPPPAPVPKPKAPKKAPTPKAPAFVDIKDLPGLNNVMADFATKHPEYFAKGFKEVAITNKAGVNGFTYMRGDVYLKPEIAKYVIEGVNHMKKGIPTTYAQEVSMSTFHHEIMHNANKVGNMRMTKLQTKYMELSNEFVSRNRLPEFMEKMGGKLENRGLMINRDNTGYNTMVRNFDKLIEISKADKAAVLKDVEIFLLNERYDKQVEGLINAIIKHSKVKIGKMQAKQLLKGALQYSEGGYEDFLKRFR